MQVTLLHVARVALPGFWPMCFIPRGQGGSLDWLGEEIGVAGPNLYSIFQEMVLEGPVLLPQYVTVTRGDGSKVALGPSLTQPCTTYRFERIEVRTSPQGRVYAVATEEEEKEEEVFDQILEERNAQFQSEKEKEIEEEQEWQEEKDFERAWKEEESDEEEEKYEEKEEKKEESKDPKKELKKKEGKGEDSGESSARERMRMLRQRRRSSILLSPNTYLVSPIYLLSISSPIS